jgi:hypothetical protein
MAGDFVSPVKHIVKVFSAVLIAMDIGFVSNPQVPASLGGAILVSK